MPRRESHTLRRHTSMTQRILALLAFCLVPSCHAIAHEGHEDASGNQPQAETGLSAMVLPSIEGPKPWSDKPVLNDPDRFQIAIMTDRTGGHRPGIWMDAVRKLNMLRPEFVVSVGDLIEGYTEDREQIDREWQEFLGFIDQMQMRFFFVAGNHDLTNPVMHEMWRERFGPEWYSFDYRGVHFVCLSSEDPQQHLGEKQLAWVEEDLAANRDARWTLVFLHKPLWTYAERGLENDGVDPTNWKRVEALLVDRPHTVFAGHVHHYVQYERNDRHYYSLATTGGGSQLRGNEYGEFDHVTWLTMEPEGPHVVNLRLDGILPAGVVTEKSIGRFNTFLRQATVRVAPILVEHDSGFDEGDLEVELINDLGENVVMEGEIDGLPLRGLTADPELVRLQVGPTGTAAQSVRLRFDERVEFASLRRATFTAKIRTTDLGPDGEAPLTAERVIPIIIDRRYACPKLAEIKIDGVLEPDTLEWYATPESPLVLGAANAWTGPADGSFEIAASHDGERVVFSIRLTDERVIAGEDGVRIILDARPAEARDQDDRLRWGTLRINATAPDESGSVEATAQGGRGWRGRDFPVEAAAKRTDAGWDVELALSAEVLDDIQGGDWDSFQMAAVMADVDEPGARPSRVVWRGSSEIGSRNTNFARFSRGE